MRESYGTLYPRFWDGPTGQALQVKGKSAVILAAFLLSNRWANMIGFYELPVREITRTLPILGKPSQIRAVLKSFSDSDVSYAFYDDANSVVWVKEMARFRLGLRPGRALNTDDNRHAAVVRLYRDLKPNAYLSVFYDRYGAELSLPERRAYTQGALEGALGGPLQGPMEGVDRGIEASNQYISTSVDQYTSRSEERRTGSPDEPTSTPPVENSKPTRGKTPHELGREPAKDGNYRVIANVVRQLLLEQQDVSDVDLKEDVRTACARLGINYGTGEVDPDVVARAIASERTKFKLGIVSANPAVANG